MHRHDVDDTVLVGPQVAKANLEHILPAFFKKARAKTLREGAVVHGFRSHFLLHASLDGPAIDGCGDAADGCFIVQREQIRHYRAHDSRYDVRKIKNGILCKKKKPQSVEAKRKSPCVGWWC